MFKDRKHQKKVIQTLIKKIVASNTQVNVELSTLKACSLTTFSGRVLKTSNKHLFVSISDNEFVIKAG